jgi:hypothetical protein
MNFAERELEAQAQFLPANLPSYQGLGGYQGIAGAAGQGIRQEKEGRCRCRCKGNRTGVTDATVGRKSVQQT